MNQHKKDTECETIATEILITGKSYYYIDQAEDDKNSVNDF